MEDKKSEFDSALAKSEGAGFLQVARELIVSNDQELDIANENLKGNKALQRGIKTWFKKHKTKAREVLNGLHEDERVLLDPLRAAEDLVKGKMGPYMAAQKRKREEAEAAARKAREEREAAARRAEEEALARVKAAEEERQRQAREALQDGERKKAEKILEEETTKFIPEVEEVPAPAEIVVPEEKKLEGTHSREDWTWELEDIDLVPRVLPNGKRPLVLDRSVITALAEAEKEKANVPGIRFFKKTTVVSRNG